MPKPGAPMYAPITMIILAAIITALLIAATEKSKP